MIFTIFGYPKSGKTLLFNLLTDKKEEVSKFSTSTHEYHKAVVDVPDKRLKQIADFTQLPAVFIKIEYLDAGAISYGEVKTSTFIDLLKRADGLVHIARGFEDKEIIHPRGSVDPVRDITTMEEELKTADFVTIETRLEKLALELKKIPSKELAEEDELLKKLKNHLENNQPLREYNFKKNEEQLIRGFKFLSLKPLLNIINSDENSFGNCKKFIKKPMNNKASIIFCGKIEQELLELEEEDRKVFQQEYGLNEYEYLKENFIKTSFTLLDLISFFTIGKDETRAWPIKTGLSAFEAAGKIHSDIQQGFIKAEVIELRDLLECGGPAKAKEKGLLRLEGKEYPIRDGEIIYFRFNK